MTEHAAPLWTASELVTTVHGTLLGAINRPIQGVSIDTRSLRSGDMFVALNGPARDGHAFVGDAFAAGAAAALVSHHPEGAAADGPLILVPDVLKALERLADAARRRSHARIIGITGSVGKTGTKEMLAAILAAQAPTHWSVASYNNHWGVPLSLARLPREAAYAVFELGMNHPGEIAALTHLVRPDIAVITTIEPAHLEFFDGLEAIADAKAEIFLGVGGAGCAVLNRDNPFFERLAAAANDRGIQHVVGFGEGPSADFRLLDLERDPTGSGIVASLRGRERRYRLAQPGRHAAINSLAALAAAVEAGADLDRALTDLATLQPLAGRGRHIEIAVGGGTATLIDDSYNASPASIRAALDVLHSYTPPLGGRRLAVLGDMRELGPQGEVLHRELAPGIKQALVDRLYCCGDLMRHTAAASEALGIAVSTAATAEELLPVLRADLRPGDILLVKGSLGSRMNDIVNPLIAARNPEHSSAI